MARAVSSRRKWTFTILAWAIAFLIFFPILWIFGAFAGPADQST